MTLDKKIEAILFFKSEPLKIKKIAQILNEKDSEVKEALVVLEESLNDRGIRLLHKEDEVMLGTAPDMGELIEALLKEDLNKDLGKAGLETLTIVLYKGPITRSGIDYIRGVNSAFILRNLLIRGLVEKKTNPKDHRGFIYSPSFELLSYLGLSKVEDLPEYEPLNEEIDQFIEEKEETENKEETPNPEDKSDEI